VPSAQNVATRKKTSIRLARIAFLVLAAGGFIAVASQNYFLLTGRTGLKAAMSRQQASLDESVRVRAEAEAPANEVATLADHGNVTARQAVETMRCAGVEPRQVPNTAPPRHRSDSRKAHFSKIECAERIRLHFTKTLYPKSVRG
jgi:hypothetical protein